MGLRIRVWRLGLILGAVAEGHQGSWPRPSAQNLSAKVQQELSALSQGKTTTKISSSPLGI